MVNGLASYEGINADALNRYYVPLIQLEKAEGKEGLKEALTKSRELSPQEMMVQFARSLQNSGSMINSIKFDDEERREALGCILRRFDPKSILCKYRGAHALYSKIYSEYKCSVNHECWTRAEDERETQRNKPTNLRKYACGLYKAAEFLSERDNVQLINNAIKASYEGSWTQQKDNLIVSAIRPIQKCIPYIGEALAYDFLKECGCLLLAKPDTHLNKIIEKLPLSDGTYSDKKWKTNSTTRAVADFAASIQSNEGSYSDVTPYRVDKMIWLLCTGNFYLHHVVIHNYDLIRDLVSISLLN